MARLLPALGHLFGLHRDSIESLTLGDFRAYREYAEDQLELMRAVGSAALAIVRGAGG